MSNVIRCPKCGSTNVECVETPHHDHRCHDCGHALLPKKQRWFDISHATDSSTGREWIKVHAGPRGVERIVPPAGEAYAFDRDLWTREVEIYRSPTGRSIRVWVDGQEVGVQ